MNKTSGLHSYSGLVKFDTEMVKFDSENRSAGKPQLIGQNDTVKFVILFWHWKMSNLTIFWYQKWSFNLVNVIRIIIKFQGGHQNDLYAAGEIWNMHSSHAGIRTRAVGAKITDDNHYTTKSVDHWGEK